MKRALFLIYVFMSSYSFAQTCCTGGVPYLGAFRLPGVMKGEIGLNLSYNRNQNSDLMLQDEIIEGHGNMRTVHTMLLQMDYGITDRFSISFVAPYLIQKQLVEFGSVERKIENMGLGDLSLLTSFRGTLKKSNYAISAGIKLPTGKTDAVDPESGIGYPFSFQSGSGSWDIMLQVYDELPIEKSKTWNWVNQLSVKINSKGNSFDSHPGYQFGHMLQLFSALSARWVWGRNLSKAFVGFSYQKRWMDKFDGGFENENTGGNWINLNVGYNHQFSPKFDLGFSASIPVYRWVNGLQLTTDSQVSLTLGYIL